MPAVKHRNCTICSKPIVLSPSAAVRAAKYGNTPEHYLNLFTTHAECTLRMREKDTIDLMRRIREGKKITG